MKMLRIKEISNWFSEIKQVRNMTVFITHEQEEYLYKNYEMGAFEGTCRRKNIKLVIGNESNGR